MTACEQPCDPIATSAGDRAHTNTRIIRITGDLRTGGTLASLRELADAAVRTGQRRVVIDLAEVETADTRLVAVLVSIARRARALGVDLDLRLSRNIKVWVRIFRLERVLTLAECA